MKTLTRLLGEQPKYSGCLALGQLRRVHGFVFTEGSAPALMAWMPARQQLPMSHIPTFIAGVPDDVVEAARVNADKPVPWGGDYSAAKTIGFQAGKFSIEGR